jgi:hypothetical protein
MKKWLVASLAIMGFVGLLSGANARTVVVYQQPVTHVVVVPTTTVLVHPGGIDSCAQTYGTSYLCITNNTSWPIVGVQAVNMGSLFNSTSWIHIPGGAIMPGTTKVVHFPVWGSGCQKLVFVRTASGTTHSFATDVCHATRLTINGW